MKIGDRVREKNSNGRMGTITSYYCYSEPAWTVRWDGYESCSPYTENSLQLIEENKTMDIKEKFVLALTPEPQKSFRKVGITNGDNLLTDDGVKIFLSWLLKVNQEKFKTEIVDDLLKAQEEEKK